MIRAFIFYIINFFNYFFVKKKFELIEIPEKKFTRKPMKFIFEEKPIDMEFLFSVKPKIKRSSSINDLGKKIMKKQKSI